MTPIISRKEAIAQGLIHYFTGKPCMRGHIEERITSSHACMACNRRRAAIFAKEHPEDRKRIGRVSNRNYRARNTDKVREVIRKCRRKKRIGNTVYFVQPGSSSNPVKIGFSNAVDYRLSVLQTGNHEPLTIIHSIPGGKEVETKIHERFAHLRLPGRKEWFSYTPEMLEVSEFDPWL